jgi:hypothetical protein
MAGKNPFLLFPQEYDFTVLNRPQVLHGRLFWHGIHSQGQDVKITVTTSVMIDNPQGFIKQILGLLIALQYLGIHVDLPYALEMGNEEMLIVVEKE